MARDIGGLRKVVQTNGTVVVSVAHVSQPDGAFTLEGLQENGVRGRGGGNVNGDFVGFIINWDVLQRCL